MKVIAIVEVETIDNKSIVKSVAPYQAINAETFADDWNGGQQARQKWEQFSNAFCHLLLESGFIDENGLHIEEYNAGSIFRFLRDNPTIMPASMTDSMGGRFFLQAISKGASMIKKGKDITINWKSIDQHTGPMTEAVMSQMMLNPARRDLLQPLLVKYAEQLNLPADIMPATDATE